MNAHYGRLSAREGTGVKLNRDEALRYLGYTGQAVDEDLLARFQKLADACERDIVPAYVWGVFEIDAAHTVWEAGATEETPQIALAGCDLVLTGNDIARHLHGARKVALMACTLGASSEREMRKHAAIDAADGVMYSSCCSALVEAAANAVEAAIVAWAAERGLHTNWRFSPGYGDLPLSVQPAFLKALDATARLGIVATPTNMLVPVKSTTALVGLFDTVQAGAEVRDACGVCQIRESCQLRKRGITCHD